VLFVHGSGSGRLSPRNQLVAAVLREHGIATLLFDLLTEVEERIDLQTRHLRFDIDLLTRRVVQVLDWVRGEEELADLPVGLFGASTGAAAALVAAVRRPDVVAAVVSRGGRPDLAGDLLSEVKAPTLLIVGGADASVIELNREAYASLFCERRLEIVEGATHLFEEPGALEAVADMAAGWFERHLMPAHGGVGAHPAA
jgi:pimeloyl-ACP methyl ester carboxylesterase